MPNKYDTDYEVDPTGFEPDEKTTTSTMTKKERPAEAAKSEPASAQPRAVIRRGWNAAQKVQESSTPYAQRFKVTEEPQIIKFIEDEPYASFRTHWVEREGQKSFICISDSREGCPLCNAGLRPSSKFAFNIAVLTDTGDFEVKSFEVGVRLIDQLKNFHNDPRQGPLSKNYWSVSKTGKGAQTQTLLQMVKERDLAEYNLKAYTDDDMAVLKNKSYSSDIIQVPSYTDLMEIAVEILDAQ